MPCTAIPNAGTPGTITFFLVAPVSRKRVTCSSTLMAVKALNRGKSPAVRRSIPSQLRVGRRREQRQPGDADVHPPAVPQADNVCPDRRCLGPVEAEHDVTTTEHEVMMKVLSPETQHKTEASGVRLDIKAGTAFDAIMDAVSAKTPAAVIEYVLVQRKEAWAGEVSLSFSTIRRSGHC